MGSEWRPFNDECLHCGDAAEVLTDTGRDNFAYDGEKARCVGCGCRGSVSVDEDGTAIIRWHDEPGCTCDWCKSHPASKESPATKRCCGNCRWLLLGVRPTTRTTGVCSEPTLQNALLSKIRRREDGTRCGVFVPKPERLTHAQP